MTLFVPGEKMKAERCKGERQRGREGDQKGRKRGEKGEDIEKRRERNGERGKRRRERKER